MGSPSAPAQRANGPLGWLDFDVRTTAILLTPAVIGGLMMMIVEASRTSRTSTASVALTALLGGGLLIATVCLSNGGRLFTAPSSVATVSTPPALQEGEPAPLLECIRRRRSVFPRSYVHDKPLPVPPAVMNRMLEAAMWAPYHGSVPPWRFVVLGRQVS